MNVGNENDEVSTNSNASANEHSDHHEGTDEQSSGDRQLHEENLDVYLCDLCDYKAITIKTLREHYHWKHVRGEKTSRRPFKNGAAGSKKKHACPFCDYTSNLIGHVKRHILIHTGETPFECSHCDYKSRDKTTLRRHVERHLRVESKTDKYVVEGQKYQCKKCKFITSFKGALSRHLLRHKDPLICKHCSAQFWKEESYKNHILLHAGVALHRCKYCDYETNDAGYLLNHMKRMHSAKKWICPECNYATSCPSDLSKHKIIHKSDRPYACDQCDYTCKRLGHLRVHSATHNSALKNYTCPFCDYRTTMIGTLKIHVRSHTGEKPYQCNVCDSAFTSRGGAKAHEYTHIKDWSQSCPHCDFKASKPHVFKKHLKIHTNAPDSRPALRSTSKAGISLIRSKNIELKTKDVPTVLSKNEGRLSENTLVELPSSLPQSLFDDNLTFVTDIKLDRDELSTKVDPEFTVSAHVERDEQVKTKEIDLLYPVKQECDSL